MRLRKHWLDIDIQRAATMATHVVGHDALLLGRGWTNVDQPGAAILERLERFFYHRRSRTTSADPTPNLSVGKNYRFVSRFAGDGRFIANDGGHGKRLAEHDQLISFLQKFVEHPASSFLAKGASLKRVDSRDYVLERKHPHTGALRPSLE